jgi:hypothetical protein
LWETRVLFIAILAAIVTLTPCAIAGDKFFIYVTDKYGNPAPDVSIEIWNGGDRVDSGYTDNNGVYISWLDSNTRYRMTARMNEHYGEWEGFPNSNTHRINLQMTT